VAADPARVDDVAPIADRRVRRSPALHVVMAAPEASPWAKTGGLADVAGALPDALDRLGHRVTLMLPRYRGLSTEGTTVAAHAVSLAAGVQPVRYVVRERSPRARVVFIDAPAYFDRPGLYGADGQDYPDNGQRFGLFAAAVLDFIERDTAVPPVDVVHAHDWQGGLISAWARADRARWPRLGQAGFVFTIHNLAYQGLFDPNILPALGVPWSVYTVDRAEFWGRVSYLKAGLTASDMVTTVSPTYAAETLTEAHGAGMHGVLRGLRDRYLGILNGIDTEIWNPADDPHLPAHFDATTLSNKLACKRALLARFGLPVGDDALARPVIGWVSRLVEQKGIDLLVDAAADVMALDATWVLVGQGEARFEAFLRSLAAQYPSRVGVFVGFDESLAHLVEAGADMFLMPSRFEPCGLNQMYSLRYGTVPIVHGVGGLDDTIRHYTSRARHPNGFKFREPTPEALVRVVRQAVRLFRDRGAWIRLMRTGMAEDHSWRTSALEYVKVYKRARREAAARASGSA
jgi:starch synthase